MPRGITSRKAVAPANLGQNLGQNLGHKSRKAGAPPLPRLRAMALRRAHPGRRRQLRRMKVRARRASLRRRCSASVYSSIRNWRRAS